MHLRTFLALSMSLDTVSPVSDSSRFHVYNASSAYHAYASTLHESPAQFTHVGSESKIITTTSGKTWKRGEVCTTGDNADPRTRPRPTKGTPMLKSYGPADGAIASHGNINSFTQDNTPIYFLVSTTYLLKSPRFNSHHTHQWQRESSRSAAPEISSSRLIEPLHDPAIGLCNERELNTIHKS